MNLANEASLKAALRGRVQKPSGATVDEREIEEIARDIREAYLEDRQFYRIVATCLGCAVIVVIAAIGYLTSQGKEHFDALSSIGLAAVGGLVGLFVTPRKG